MVQKISLAFFVLVFLAGSLGLHYVTPRYLVAEISGADAKRAEGVPRSTATVTTTPLDIYFVYMVLEDKSAAIMRNEDTGWGMPPYFKFDAADLQSEAQRLQGKTAQIKYYGWRSKLFGLFPNVLTIKEAGENPPPSSWTRYACFTLWWIFLVIIFPYYYSFFSRKKE